MVGPHVTDDAPPSEHLAVTGLDEWSHRCSTAYVPLEVDADGDFRGALRVRDLGPLGVSQVGATPSVVRRTARRVAADPRESVLLSVFLQGSTVVAQHGRAGPVAPGGGYLLASDQPYGIRLQSPTDILILRVPRTLAGLGPATLREIAGRVLPPDTGEIDVLGRELAAALLHGAGAGAGRQELLVDLLRAVTHRMRYGDRSRPYLSGAALWASARWYVERHHGDPGLGVEELAARFMVSRRHLEQQFARRGTTPAAYLRQVRAESARRLLLADRTATVEHIAHTAGFTGVDTFIRAFRRRHGQTPADWRRQQPGRGVVATPLPPQTAELLSDLHRLAAPADAPFLAPPGHEKRSTPTSRSLERDDAGSPGLVMKGDGPGPRRTR
ncbi:AraC family transcriptional regulator [Pimelobacter simplex]|uniref:AraC family transcriptional regulator n=1 Tax=Nocardioides simplex TaxID=2045 RepID=A0A7J5DQD1_NOCSI|nr:AraC family transcriptional regulator [Pimelobacter simplex]